MLLPSRKICTTPVFWSNVTSTDWVPFRSSHLKITSNDELHDGTEEVAKSRPPRSNMSCIEAELRWHTTSWGLER